MGEAYELVQQQAEDEGLWFRAEYASEDYLQRALRELHDSVERDFNSKETDRINN